MKMQTSAFFRRILKYFRELFNPAFQMPFPLHKLVLFLPKRLKLDEMLSITNKYQPYKC